VAKGKPNMRDVAQAANVSLSAVWMVIHNKPGVALETADKIWASIDRLGYIVKSNSKDQSENSIGLLIEKGSIPAMMDSFYGDILHGFQAEAQRSGYQVILMMFDRATENLELLRKGLMGKIAGLVVANDGDITPAMVVRLKAMSVPVVLIESHIDDQQFSCVVGDNFTAGYLITRHLLSLGHREIAVLPGPAKYSSLVDRQRGCMAALAEAGLIIRPEWTPPPVSGHPMKGYLQMKEILALDHYPTAVVSISDKTALGAMEAIREAGLRIPEDIAIVGIDNIAESAHTRPPLTTVHIPKLEMGILAFRCVKHLINSEEADIPVKMLVYGELVVRESCGANSRS
jgi:DNA-binding LacI/PurR family transcriptional regulator